MINIPICPECKGRGLRTCLACGGTGIQDGELCPNCGGAAYQGPCPSCNGRGMKSWEEALVFEEP